MDTTKLNVRFPTEWVTLLQREAEKNKVKVSDIIRNAVLAWWQQELAKRFEFEIEPSELKDDSLLKLKVLADSYGLDKYDVDLENIESFEMKNQLMRFTRKGKAKAE